MLSILKNLEPIRYGAKKIIYNELDDVTELLFIEKGLYDIGYEVNKNKIFKIRRPNQTVIGTFEICFNKRMLFIFRTFNECKGYFIRKRNLRMIEDEFNDMY